MEGVHTSNYCILVLGGGQRHCHLKKGGHPLVSPCLLKSFLSSVVALQKVGIAEDKHIFLKEFGALGRPPLQVVALHHRLHETMA